MLSADSSPDPQDISPHHSANITVTESKIKPLSELEEN